MPCHEYTSVFRYLYRWAITSTLHVLGGVRRQSGITLQEVSRIVEECYGVPWRNFLKQGTLIAATGACGQGSNFQRKKAISRVAPKGSGYDLKKEASKFKWPKSAVEQSVAQQARQPKCTCSACICEKRTNSWLCSRMEQLSDRYSILARPAASTCCLFISCPMWRYGARRIPPMFVGGDDI